MYPCFMRFDAVVVGSGFGGSVSAARLAEKGLRVLVLERGPWWGPLHRDSPKSDRREFPRGPWGARKLLRSLRAARNGRRYERVFYRDGLLEFHLFDHLMSVTGSGVGGGSHIYTNIMEEPEAGFFECFPSRIRASEIHQYYDKVRQMLRPVPLPDRPQKNRVFEDAVRAAGFVAPRYPDLAVALGSDPRLPEKVINAAGVVQFTSRYQGDALVGCTDGSKTTLDLTYIPLALKNGAELRPLCEVIEVGAFNGGYRVRYLDHRTRKIGMEEAPRLILAAGGLNTQRLLYAARDTHRTLPRISPMLGRRFSPNADMAHVVWRSKKLHDSSFGPSFGAFTRVESEGKYRFLVGEVGFPVGALPLPWPLSSWLRNSTVLFCMGRDASTGTVSFDGEGLRTSLARSMDRRIFDEIEEAVQRIAGQYEPSRIFFNLFSGKGSEGLFTVHPLGGCSMADSPEQGVTNHLGEVFGHRSLYVADGSLYPKSPGLPPSLTIAALAERQAALMD